MKFDRLTSSSKWQRLNGQSVGPLLPAVEHLLLRERTAGHTIKVCIGTDSQVKGDRVEFVTVIVFRRERKGAFMLKHRLTVKGLIPLKQRMLMEVTDSIAVGWALSELLELHAVPMEIHADVNTDPAWKSNIAFKEVMGYVLGMGMSFVAKPDAFASSYCADKVVKGGPWPRAQFKKRA